MVGEEERIQRIQRIPQNPHTPQGTILVRAGVDADQSGQRVGRTVYTLALPLFTFCADSPCLPRSLETMSSEGGMGDELEIESGWYSRPC